MGVLREKWCFCSGGAKSERMKAAIFSGKGPSMARIGGSGTGFLIHRNLLLTTHANLPSVSAAESAEIQLQSGVPARLFPHRFFITSSVLDLTIVGLDAIDGDANALVHHIHNLRSSSNPNLALGNVVYLLGCTEEKELTVGEGKVVIATDNLIKLCTDGVTWSPGSAGFDVHGNLAFMVCDPMKLSTSPNTRSTSTSSSSTSSWRRDLPMQFGIPIPIILDWLNQYWEGNLDELNKPKLPLMRLMSAGQKSDHSCASFTMRQVFKSPEAENEGTPTSSAAISRTKEPVKPSGAPTSNTSDDVNGNGNGNPPSGNHTQGIPTPEIYESPKLTSILVRKKESSIPIQLLDINFPPRIVRLRENDAREPQPQPQALQHPVKGEEDRLSAVADAEIASVGSVNGAAQTTQSEVQSSASLVEEEVSEARHEYYSSEGETTMYSAETAESRNYPSPKESRFHPVGRSQSCVNYNNRWGPVQRHGMARGAMYEKQTRKVYSQGASSRRSNEYYSPTVSSVMKRNKEQQLQLQLRPGRARQSAVHSSPRWNF